MNSEKLNAVGTHGKTSRQYECDNEEKGMYLDKEMLVFLAKG